MTKEIENLEDIQHLVNSFYTLVQKDPLIGDIFITKITDWPMHLEKMYRFWQTILLEVHTYTGSPFPPHAKMPLTTQHFDRWLTIWKENIDLYFEGAKAEEAKMRGERMAAMFLSKIEFHRGSKFPIL